MLKKFVFTFDEYKNFILNEAQEYKNLENALKDILVYFEKNIGKLYLLPGVQIIKKDDGTELQSLHYIHKSGKSIRFNWLNSSKDIEIYSVSFYDNENIFKPKFEINTEGKSISKIIPEVTKAFDDKILDVTKLEERKIDLKEEGISKQKKSKKEEDITPELKAAQKKLDETEYADPKTVFEDLNGYVQMVINGLQSSLLIIGSPGLGKSYNVEQMMKKNNLKEIEPIDYPEGLSDEELKDMGYDPDEETPGDWVKIKGATTAFGLYSNLFRYNNKIIVFDDCDKVFHDEDSINILKGALDTGDKRVISWISKTTMSKNSPFPKRFEFKGKVIFITNLEFKQLDSALRNRSFLFDLTLKTQDILLLIKTLLPKIMPNILTMDSKNEAYKYLEDAARRGENVEISIRSFTQLAKIVQSKLPNYISMLKMQMRNIRK